MSYKVGQDVSVDMIGRIVNIKHSARGEKFFTVKGFTILGTPHTARVPESMLCTLPTPEEVAKQWEISQNAHYVKARQYHK